MSRFEDNEFVPQPKRRPARPIEEGEYVFLRSAGFRHPVQVLRVRGKDAWIMFMVGGSVWCVDFNKLER